MTLGQVFQSIAAWQKLSAINMKAAIAYKILGYTKLVEAEYAIAERQRIAIVREITGTKEGEDASLEPDTPELLQYVQKFNAVLVVESDLKPLELDFAEVVNAVDDKDESLTVQDLAMLEPFFPNSGVEKVADAAA